MVLVERISPAELQDPRQRCGCISERRVLCCGAGGRKVSQFESLETVPLQTVHGVTKGAVALVMEQLSWGEGLTSSCT